MNRLSLAVIALLFCASPAWAQVHPCDAPPQINPNVGPLVRFVFCVPQSEALTAAAYRVYVDGSTVPLFNGSLTPVGTPNAAGFVLVETPPQTIARGNHSFQASIVNIGGEGAKSAAFPFGVLGLPVAPTRPGVRN